MLFIAKFTAIILHEIHFKVLNFLCYKRKAVLGTGLIAGGGKGINVRSQCYYDMTMKCYDYYFHQSLLPMTNRQSCLFQQNIGWNYV